MLRVGPIACKELSSRGHKVNIIYSRTYRYNNTGRQLNDERLNERTQTRRGLDGRHNKHAEPQVTTKICKMLAVLGSGDKNSDCCCVNPVVIKPFCVEIGLGAWPPGVLLKKNQNVQNFSAVFRGPAAPPVAGGGQTCKGPQGKGV